MSQPQNSGRGGGPSHQNLGAGRGTTGGGRGQMYPPYPQAAGVGGPQGRGPRTPGMPGPGGRGGGGQQQQRTQMGAWQPTHPVPPPSMPYGAGRGVPPPQANNRGNYPPQAAAGYYNPYAQQNPYQARGAYYPPQGMPPNMLNGVYYPPPQPQNPQASGASSTTDKPAVVLAPRTKKPLTITDKDGNVLDLSAVATKPAAESSTTPAPAPADATAAGEKLKQAALEKIKAEEEAKKAAAEEKAKQEAEEKAKKEAEEKAQLEAEKAKKEAEEKAKKEEEEKAKASAKPTKTALEALMQKAAPIAVPDSTGVRRLVYSKDILNQIRKSVPLTRPSSLPDLTIVKLPSKKGGGRNQGGGDWSRGGGSQRRPSQKNEHNEWSRGQAPPKARNDKRGGGRGGRGGNQPPLYDGPVAPLVQTANRWRPQKNSSPFIVAEKKVKAILNKMTKEKFDRLSEQMIDIPLKSYEVLTMIIENVYDKAIDEPAFGDMYADLCVRLSQSASSNASFIHIIESDEEPPTENETNDEPQSGESTSNPVYRWSNDIGTNDSELVGPFESAEECINIALNTDEAPERIDGSGKELDLVQVLIKNGTFIKVMKESSGEGKPDSFYTVFFPVREADDCGQQLSGIFLSKVECESDARKKNSFKRSLLNKCEEEFNKQDIYVDWKKEKAAYLEKKSSLSEAEQAETEEELDFRRIRIKKQMLGNIKFIGQLYKKGLLKEKIMRYCIAQLLKLKELKDREGKNPEYEDSGERDIDEEDHEAICNMFTTIGSTIDKPAASELMEVCFTKISSLSVDTELPSRSRFMYKDLLELRANSWVPRRKVEKAKTLEEIRKDVEREERRQAMAGRGGGGNDRRVGQRSNDSRGPKQVISRKPVQKPAAQTDSDGFTTIVSNKSSFSNLRTAAKPQSKAKLEPVAATPSVFSALSDDHNGPQKPAPLSEDELKRKIKGMISDYMFDGGSEKELMLSMDELSHTPNAGMQIITQTTDIVMDCRDDERTAIFSIIPKLVAMKRIQPSEVKEGLADPIEFFDSTLLDCPRGCEYLGELLANFLLLEVVDVPWLCDQLEKISDKQVPAKVIRETMGRVKRISDLDTARQIFGATNESELTKLLGEESYNALSKEVL